MIFCWTNRNLFATRAWGAAKRHAQSAAPHRLTFCGRHFSICEVEMIREVTAQCSALSLTEISRTVCELLGWKRPNGKLQNHEGRLLLERLRDQGQMSLPAVQPFGGRGPWPVRFTWRSDPQPEITGSAGQFEPLSLTVVGAGGKEDCRRVAGWGYGHAMACPYRC